MQGFLSSVLVSSSNRKLNLRFGPFLQICDNLSASFTDSSPGREPRKYALPEASGSRKSATTSQSRLRRASSPGRGAFCIAQGPPLRRGLRPSWGWKAQRRGGYTAMEAAMAAYCMASFRSMPCARQPTKYPMNVSPAPGRVDRLNRYAHCRISTPSFQLTDPSDPSVSRMPERDSAPRSADSPLRRGAAHDRGAFDLVDHEPVDAGQIGRQYLPGDGRSVEHHAQPAADRRAQHGR